MAKNNESGTIEISRSSSTEKERSVIRKSCSSEEEEEEGSPIRHILCLKRNDDLKRFEETEDCFILDFDPFEPPDISKVSVSSPTHDGVDVDADLAIVAVKGQVVVACRDYPHPRHLCQKFPFETTPHESCCELLLHASIGKSNHIVML
ncbi:RPM1 interacting protein 13 isoform X2 [Ziziphus jujuba]|uniref:RPM1 interacting protein 13 isoform X2 n=1 Tax=Ziziphus jujuba TaxID=326968 RepID=A0ABM3IDR4_ZIZJJ|nr:RPM1 interacting protein 13 isoform X2 [Ziziphus jujuba]